MAVGVCKHPRRPDQRGAPVWTNQAYPLIAESVGLAQTHEIDLYGLRVRFSLRSSDTRPLHALREWNALSNFAEPTHVACFPPHLSPKTTRDPVGETDPEEPGTGAEAAEADPAVRLLVKNIRSF